MNEDQLKYLKEARGMIESAIVTLGTAVGATSSGEAIGYHDAHGNVAPTDGSPVGLILHGLALDCTMLCSKMAMFEMAERDRQAKSEESGDKLVDGVPVIGSRVN